MPIRPGRLWDQYTGKGRAELLRGCGLWPAQEHPCVLEPPFEAFDARSLTVWDCLVNGWEAPFEGSWLRRAFAVDGTIHPLGAPLVLPPIPLLETDELVVITVRQFPEDETTLPIAGQLLRSLLALRHPVSFELIGVGARPRFDSQKIAALVKSGRQLREAMDAALIGWTDPTTSIQFTAHRSDLPLLRQQLLLHYANSAIVAGQTEPLDLSASLRSDERSIGGTLVLESLHVFPLRTFRELSPDVLAVAIAAMDTLEKHDWAILQVLFCPAFGNWSENSFAALTNPCNPDEHVLDADDIRQAKQKFQSPLFAASVRLAASRRDVFRQLVGWAEQFSNSPRQRLIVNEADWEAGAPSDDERNWLDLDIDYRCTHRPGLLLGADELAGLVHLPGARIVSERFKISKARTRAARQTAAASGSVVLGQNVHRGEAKPACIPADIRPWHCYVTGATGTGKSTLLLNVLLQDIRAGFGVGIIEPHGDLIRDALSQIPRDRLSDVVYFNPADFDFPPALNILQASSRLEREHLIAETVATLHRFFPDAWGPRLEHVLLHSLATVSLIQGGTLREVRRLLTDENYRYRIVSRLTDSELIAFWNKEFPQLPKGSIDPVLNKLSPFLMKPTVRNVVCQPQTLFNFDDVLNGRRIFLANLPFGLLGEAVACTLGTFLTTKLLGATFRRAALPKSNRVPFYLFIDEFQSFLNLGRGFDKILSEARKFGLVLTTANQHARQLTPEVRAAIMGNVGTVVAFRLGLDDARIMAHDLLAFTAEEILSLDCGEAFARVGSSQNVFNVVTSPPPQPPADDPTADIIAHCRKRYARPRSQVEQRFKSASAGAASHVASRNPKKVTNPPSATRSDPPSHHPSPPPPEVMPDDLSDFVV